MSLSTGCPSGGGVLRDYLLRRFRMLKLLGKKRKRQLLRCLSSDPLSEGHPVDRDNCLCLIEDAVENRGLYDYRVFVSRLF